ncbi:MAG: hypothetical protein KDA84_13275 [Planctomycetaceae bacterium]|nr:hypothetical protein [Planctomycetaceae bacterium]
MKLDLMLLDSFGSHFNTIQKRSPSQTVAGSDGDYLNCVSLAFLLLGWTRTGMMLHNENCIN